MIICNPRSLINTKIYKNTNEEKVDFNKTSQKLKRDKYKQQEAVE